MSAGGINMKHSHSLSVAGPTLCRLSSPNVFQRITWRSSACLCTFTCSVSCLHFFCSHAISVALWMVHTEITQWSLNFSVNSDER